MRFFVEMGTVTDSQCLPEQTGYTISENAENFPLEYSTMALLGFGGNDLENATRQNCDGWYATVIPAVCVGLCVRMLGLAAIHCFGRSQQIKQSLWYEMSKNKRVKRCVILFITCTLIMFATTSYLMLRHTSYSPQLAELDFKPGKV